MTRSLSIFSPLILFFIGIMACTMDDSIAPSPLVGENNGSNPTDTAGNRPLGGPMRIRVGSTTFTATLLSNATVRDFKARLPMTLSMKELNGNEKFAQLPNELPTNASNPGIIQTGDLTLYGSSTLVLFYKTFPTSYSYTRLGRVDNPLGLATALGTGNATVTFELN